MNSPKAVIEKARRKDRQLCEKSEMTQTRLSTSKPIIIRRGTVITPSGARPNHAVLIQGEHIVAVCPDDEVPLTEMAQVINATGLIVAPGFVDVHVHGGGGHDVMDATPQALAGLSHHLARHGVTSFVPTTVAAPHDDLLRVIRNVAAVMARPPDGARPLGLHLEGPYLNVEKKGAQPAATLRLPDLGELDEYLAAGPVKKITLAPELEGAEALARRAVGKGVKVSLGHTAADYEQTRTAIAWGATHASHTFNAMSGLHHRQPGATGAILTSDEVYAEIIADFVHIHPAIVDLVVRAKGVERTVLVSDAVRATGLPDGPYEFGGQKVTVREGVCRLADGTLAGSTLALDQALRNVMSATGLSLVEALPMATRVPAASIGMAGEIGSLAPGYRADVVLLDTELQVVMTLVGGQWPICYPCAGNVFSITMTSP